MITAIGAASAYWRRFFVRVFPTTSEFLQRRGSTCQKLLTFVQFQWLRIPRSEVVCGEEKPLGSAQRIGRFTRSETSCEGPFLPTAAFLSCKEPNCEPCTALTIRFSGPRTCRYLIAIVTPGCVGRLPKVIATGTAGPAGASSGTITFTWVIPQISPGDGPA